MHELTPRRAQCGKREAAPAIVLGAPMDPAGTQGFLQNLHHHHGQVVCLRLSSCKGGNSL